MRSLPRPTDPDQDGEPIFVTLRSSSACDAEAARRYAFDGLDAFPGWGRVRCATGSRYRMFFLRSRADGPNSELSWRVYEICDTHVHRLRELDDAMKHAGHLSQLHPLTRSSLHLIEAPTAAARPTARSLPAL